MLTKAIDILYSAKQDGIEIILDNDQLQLKLPKKGSVNKNLLEEIRSNKKSIIDFLKDHEKINGNGHKLNKFDRASIQHIPLSFSQERLWFIDQLEGSVQYHIPAVLRFKGLLNKEALAFSLQSIINRHEVLRSVIQEKGGEAFQYIKEKDSWQLVTVDGAHYNQDSKALQQYIDRSISKPFDLSKDDMMRVHLIALNEQEHVLVLTMHHIVSDGWSLSIFIRELVAFYRSYIENSPAQVQPLELQYADYALWQRQYLQGEVLDKKVRYWKEKLQGVTFLPLPTDYARPAVQSTKGALISFNLDKEVSDQLQHLSHKQGITLFMTLLASFKVLLYHYTNQEDICVGTPSAGRQQQEVEELIGFFVNTLALRSEVSGDDTFLELLQQVRTTMLEAYDHQDVPFEKVVNAVVKERDMSRHPLFQVMFVLQNTPAAPEVHLGAVELLEETVSHNTSKFDITLGLRETADGLQGGIEYSTDLFKEATIERMIKHYKELLFSIIKEPRQKIGALSMVTAAEKQQLLEEFNNTAVPYPKDKSVIDLFEEQAAKTPNAVAVVFEEEQLTYRELNEKANQLGHYLKGKGIQPGNNVGLLSYRRIEMVISILGILKAGGVYVPFNTEYPAERLKYIIEDAAITHIVYTDDELLNLFELGEYEFINFNEAVVSSTQSPDVHIGIDSPVYIMYTSGTTGHPRGIRVSNENIIKLVYEPGEISVKPEDRMLQWSNYAFDGSVYEIYSSLLKGASLHLIQNQWASDIDELSRVIKEQKITVCFITTALFNTFIDIDPVVLKGLRKILFGGEMVSLSHVHKAFSVVGPGKIVHVYGPTETTVYATYFPVENVSENSIVPIGRPLANTKLLVLNKNKQLVPIGVPGELYIGGASVSLGYVNNEVLTSEKFIADPFCIEPASKVYKTGDLGRWLEDGNIEFMGRRDDQVKIRGYRIELGEIENVLQQSRLVSGVVVLAKEDISGNKRLVGYIVPEGTFDKHAIITYLQGRLPGYMVPVHWVELQRLPLTPNGKVDKKALPEPEFAISVGEQRIAPQNEAEKLLAEIWGELLKIQDVGVKDNFFELGGHSLMVLQLVDRVRKLGVKIEAKDLFAHQTIEQQSNFIATSLKLLQTATEGNYIIPIQPEGNRIPLFAFTEFLLYSKVGEYISKDQPFYSIERSPYEKKEDIAAHYIREIKKIYPHGPYCLAGFCKWGDIAVEMAHALTAQGDEVPLLVLIEYYSRKAMRSRASLKFLRPKMKYFFNTLKENDSFTGKGRYIVGEIVNVSQFIYNKVKGRYKDVRVGNKTYSGKVALVKASDTYEYHDDCNMGWSENFIGDVENIIIEGDHLNIMRNPAAAQLAEKLNVVLEKVYKNYKSKLVTK